jgi:WS/DGAT/MGAT family acyltransferase
VAAQPTTTNRSTPPPAGRFAVRFNESDALLWNIERDPSLRTTIVAIARLDRAPNWDRLRARVAEAAAAVPRLRQRVVPTPLRLAPPAWADDEQFDLDYHLRRVVAPAPADFESVLRLAAPIAMAPFDADRPLWEFTLVEGLHGGQAALIEKVHHCVTDGVGGMAIARLIVDDRRRARRHVQHDAAVGDGDADDGSPWAATAHALADETHIAASALGNARALSRLTASAIQHPLGLVNGAAGGVRSIGRLLRPALRPLSPVMDHRGRGRRLEAFEVPLEAMHAAGHAAGGTLNDAFLAAVARGMRDYHERHGVWVPALRVTMPINLRAADDPAGGNRFTPVRFVLPIADDDPMAQMQRIGALARRWRHEPALSASDAIAATLNRLPVVATTALFGSMLKGVDLVATNVPGLAGPTYLAGAEVLAHHAFPPPSGAACGIAFMSHGAHGCIGITVDTAAVPDPATLRDCLVDGFATILTTGEH